MNIKRGVMAGSLNPNQWSYLPSNYTFTGAQGGRIGYAGGGSEDPMLIEEYKSMYLKWKRWDYNLCLLTKLKLKL